MSKKTRFVYDTELIEDGRTTDVISVGIVREDEESSHAVNADMPIHRTRERPWLMENVVPSLPIKHVEIPHQGKTVPLLDLHHPLVKPHKIIAKEVLEFLTSGENEPELWAFYSAYAH